MSESLSLKLRINSLTEMRRFAEIVGRALPLGSVVGLTGLLGAGKTEFVRALISALKFKDKVTSPSYVLENIYQSDIAEIGVRKVSHWDLYRLSSEDYECLEAIAEIAKSGDALCFIEWSEKSVRLRDLLSLQIEIHFAGFFLGRPAEILSEERVVVVTDFKDSGVIAKITEGMI